MGPYSPRLRGNQGLSPRMRGNRWPSNTGLPYAGSIPAHAGEPLVSGEIGQKTRVYPRACGGTVQLGGISAPETGLSPRMRGNQVLG